MTSQGRATILGAQHVLAAWTPIWFGFSDTGPRARWCFTDGVQFTDPYFDQTIDRCLGDPFRLLFWRETGIGELADYAAAQPGLEPSGFIFHASRCGSTLVAQMFAALESALVISEAPPLDRVLRAQLAVPELSDRAVVDWLRWMASALGQPRRSSHRRLVIKLDAWAIFQLPLIRRAFPDAPCMFLYRDPVEIVVSQLAHRGYHMLPGTLPTAWVGLSPLEMSSLRPEEYCAAVLRGIGEAALAGARAGELTLVPYGELPDAVTETVAPLFGLEVDEAERAIFADVVGRDAKNPALPFTADSAHKQGKASASVRAAVGVRAGAVYEALELQRQSGS